jgi:hypothetical protein
METNTTQPPRLLGIDELASKVRWEGGILDALEYGIGSEEIADPELATIWSRMEQLYNDLRPVMKQAQRLLSAAR